MTYNASFELMIARLSDILPALRSLFQLYKRWKWVCTICRRTTILFYSTSFIVEDIWDTVYVSNNDVLCYDMFMFVLFVYLILTWLCCLYCLYWSVCCFFFLSFIWLIKNSNNNFNVKKKCLCGLGFDDQFYLNPSTGW